MSDNSLQLTDGVTSKKELALAKAGATREASYKAMVDGLTSKRMTVDKFGDEHWEDDTTNRLKSAELISRLNGDLKESPTVDNRSVVINVGADALAVLMEMGQDIKRQLDALPTSGQQTGEIIDITAHTAND